MELTIYYELNAPALNSYLGIRDIHILTNSELGKNLCAFDQPLRNS